MSRICLPLVRVADDTTLEVSPPPAVEYGLRTGSLLGSGAGIALLFDPERSAVHEVVLQGRGIEAVLTGSADPGSERELHKAIEVAIFEVLMTASVQPLVELDFD